MARHVVLLRGVNVGGHNKLPMTPFREVLESLDYTDVATYLASGNAVVSSQKRGSTAIAAEIERAIATNFDLQIPVLVRSAERLREIVDANPLVALDDNPTHLHVAFLSAKPTQKDVAKINQAAFAPDQFQVVEDAAYLHYPHGAGRSKLDPGKVFAPLGGWNTSRNWRTVSQLLERATAR